MKLGKIPLQPTCQESNIIHVLITHYYISPSPDNSFDVSCAGYYRDFNKWVSFHTSHSTDFNTNKNPINVPVNIHSETPAYGRRLRIIAQYIILHPYTNGRFHLPYVTISLKYTSWLVGTGKRPQTDLCYVIYLSTWSPAPLLTFSLTYYGAFVNTILLPSFWIKWNDARRRQAWGACVMSQIWRNTFPVSDSGNVDGETEVVTLCFWDWSLPKTSSLVLSI